MSYLSNGLGPSPFLTASFNHFNGNNFATSNHPHYSTNSYTNMPNYLSSYASPQSHYQQKYFPKQMISVLPGVSHISSQQEQKLLNPLNTYSGNAINSLKMSSPFNRGQIYYGKKAPNISPESSSMTLMDQLDGESNYTSKRQNPFHKKYLLSSKNKQLEDYALYSSVSSYELSEYETSKRNNQRQNRKPAGGRQQTLNEQQVAEQVLKMVNKYTPIDQRGQSKKSNQNSSENVKTYENQTEQVKKFKTTINSQRLNQYLIESQVDEKQFGSFGQGNEYSNQNIRVDRVDQGDSLIVGLAKMTSKESREGQYKAPQQKARRQPVFIDSDDDERKSGTFKVPQAIIDEINNPRIPSTVFKRGKDASTPVMNEKSYHASQRSQRQKNRYSKEQAIQVGRNPPSKITMRGRVYEKIL